VARRIDEVKPKLTKLTSPASYRDPFLNWKRVRSIRRPQLRRALLPFVYLSPAIAILLFVYAYPIIQLIQLSTQKVITYDNTIDVGMANFSALFNDPAFLMALGNNIRLMLGVPILISISVVCAALLYDRVSGWKVYRAIIFLPYVMATPVVGVAFSHLLRLNGPINTLFRNLGLDVLAFDWLGDPKVAPWILLGVIVWKELGFGVILFLSRLLSVSAELFEAAILDGANWWQRLWHISVPELRGVIEFYAVLQGITMLSWVFAYVYTMTGGGPGNSTMVLEFYIYRKAFGIGAGGRQFGIAAAVSVLLLGTVLVLLASQALIRKRWREAA
jgi:ABC-type sugar transport system permease subunit